MIKKIGYVSMQNPYTNRRAWSGTIYKIREAIEKAGYEVIWIPYGVSPIIRIFLKYSLKIWYGKGFEYNRHPLYLQKCAKSLDFSLINRCDALFFPGGAQIMEFTKVNKPIIYYSDATYHSLYGYYSEIKNSKSEYFGDKYERLAINHCSIMIYSSHWASKSAEDYYGRNPKNLYVLEFGANIDDKDIVHSTPYKEGELRILFSGVDWERKGAVQAIEAVEELNKRGITSKLYLCGIRNIPKSYKKLPSCVENMGFLNKNVPEQYNIYIEVFKKSHIFLLPTKAECSATVLCEASAYGLPIFSYDTGGLGDYVKDGVNGYKLPLGSTGKQFADAIENSLKKGELQNLAIGGIKLFEERLSWNAWSKDFRKIIDES